MKYCTHCGKELLDEAVICVHCGCSVKSITVKDERKISKFERHRKLWISILSVLFSGFAVAIILILTSPEYIDTADLYAYLHTDLGKLGSQISVEGAIEWVQRVEDVKSELIPYYIGIGTCAVLALAALVGDILLFTTKNKYKQQP